MRCNDPWASPFIERMWEEHPRATGLAFALIFIALIAIGGYIEGNSL